MKLKSCDEFGTNLWEAQRQWGCTLSAEVAEELTQFVSSRYGTGEFGTLLDAACDSLALEGNERRAYKMFLGLHFGARGRVKAKERREAFAIPFAPR